jgi:hypothetical protein
MGRKFAAYHNENLTKAGLRGGVKSLEARRARKVPITLAPVKGA